MTRISTTTVHKLYANVCQIKLYIDSKLSTKSEIINRRQSLSLPGTFKTLLHKPSYISK